MKRSFFILAIILLSSSCFALLRLRTASVRARTPGLIEKCEALSNKLCRVEEQIAVLQQELSREKTEAKAPTPEPLLDPELANWLLARSFRDAPAGIITKLRAALGMPWAEEEDYVLVTKTTLRSLSLAPVQRTDKLSDTVCGVLAIAPEPRARIEAALARTRVRFNEWAFSNVQREGASNDIVVRFTIPRSNDASSAFTNELYSALREAIGVERSDFFNGYADSWFQNEFGYFGAVTNSLAVRHSANGSGKFHLEFVLTRDGTGSYGRMSNSGPIDPQNFPAAFRSVFPGGWKELAEREGFELPVEERVQ